MSDLSSILIPISVVLFCFIFAGIVTFIIFKEPSSMDRIEKLHAKSWLVTIYFDHWNRWYIVKIYHHRILQCQKVCDTRLAAEIYALTYLDEKGAHAR